jgi:hypothetical protein
MLTHVAARDMFAGERQKDVKQGLVINGSEGEGKEI